jgi:hypothetical protein
MPMGSWTSLGLLSCTLFSLANVDTIQPVHTLILMSMNTSVQFISLMDDTLATKRCGKLWCKCTIPTSSTLKHCDHCRALDWQTQHDSHAHKRAAVSTGNITPVAGQKHAHSPQPDPQERPTWQQKTSVARDSADFELEEVLDSGDDSDDFEGHKDKVRNRFLCNEPVFTFL